MGRRPGPQLPSLIYDKAFEVDHVMRSEAADSHHGQGRTNRPATGRIDSCIPTAGPSRAPCAGDVHRFVIDKSREVAFSVEHGLSPCREKRAERRGLSPTTPRSAAA